MNKCFVIQPFDKGPYDKRYEDVLTPAIIAAGLEPYRVDRDPTATIPIDEIETGIKGCEACVADISVDNPNVWFELGYALASQRDVVLLCSMERKGAFPFDVQHRSIVRYATESSRDFNDLAERITSRLKAFRERKAELGQLAQIVPTSTLEGLDQYEIAALVAVTQGLDDPEDGTSAYVVRQDMERAGFTALAATMGLRSLLEKQMLQWFKADDRNGEEYTAYRVTPAGMRWLFANKGNLTLRRERRDETNASELVGDIPF